MNTDINQQIAQLEEEREKIKTILESGNLSDDDTQKNNDIFQKLSRQISELKVIRFMDTV